MISDRIDIPPRSRILIIALRRLGDVLLSTPLIRSIRNAWPLAQIDVLVFADTAGILDCNPDIDTVISMPSSPTTAQSLTLGFRLWRQYDLAVSTQTGDRPTAFAILAGRARVAPVDDRPSGRAKRILLQRSVLQDPRLHKIDSVLRIADALGIERATEVVTPGALTGKSPACGDYGVIHAAPFFKYKRWTASGWRTIAARLASRGIPVIATGGPSPPERSYLDEVWNGAEVLRCEGQFGWRELTGILAGARIYVGPDTSVTHLAAATGCPTVALYGPTDPRLWGPWPKHGPRNAWLPAAPCQQQGNVWLLQHLYPCSPCQLEGCERNLLSDSECMRQLSPDHVWTVIEGILATATTG